MNANIPDSPKVPLRADSPSQSCCICAWINEHYKHSNPIKPRKQSAPSPWLYCTAQTTKGAVKPSHKKRPTASSGQLRLLCTYSRFRERILPCSFPAPIPAGDGNTRLPDRAIPTRGKALVISSADKSIGKRSSHHFPKPN